MDITETTLIARNRVSNDFKYLALYWALGFEPNNDGVFSKGYTDCRIAIDAEKGEAYFSSPLTLIGSKALSLNTPESFVILEAIDRLLELGYNASEIIIDPNNEWDIYLDGIYIKCLEWGSSFSYEGRVIPRRGTYISVLYTSRLYSGFIDRREAIITGDNEEYDYGIMDYPRDKCVLMKLGEHEENGFTIRGNEVIAYKGHSKKLVIPEGVTSIASCLFWDNQDIEEVILPKSLIRIGGDLFYNCRNLKKVTIPQNVKEMGDDPFAGCPNLELSCLSPYFRFDNHLLYKGMKLIHCQIKNAPKNIIVDEGTTIIGKHAFYLCDSIESITLPTSFKKNAELPFFRVSSEEARNIERCL